MWELESLMLMISDVTKFGSALGRSRPKADRVIYGV
jgi:hypothetical protein